MTQNELILYIIVAILTLIIGSGGIFALIRFLRKNKVSDKEWEAQLQLIAFMLEAGVDVPKEIIVSVIRREFTAKKFATKIHSLGIDIRDFKKTYKKGN